MRGTSSSTSATWKQTVQVDALASSCPMPPAGRVPPGVLNIEYRIASEDASVYVRPNTSA